MAASSLRTTLRTHDLFGRDKLHCPLHSLAVEILMLAAVRMDILVELAQADLATVGDVDETVSPICAVPHPGIKGNELIILNTR